MWPNNATIAIPSVTIGYVVKGLKYRQYVHPNLRFRRGRGGRGKTKENRMGEERGGFQSHKCVITLVTSQSGHALALITLSLGNDGGKEEWSLPGHALRFQIHV